MILNSTDKLQIANTMFYRQFGHLMTDVEQPSDDEETVIGQV